MSEFAGPCLLQFNGVFSKFVKQENKINVAQTQGSIRVQKLRFTVGTVPGNNNEHVATD